MSKVTVNLNQGNFAILDYDVSKTFIRSNFFETETLENTSGGVADFEQGTLLGRVTATGNVIPLVSGAGDGSEIPFGVLAEDVDQLADAGTVDVAVCIAGDVAEEKLIIDAGDTLETVIAGRMLKDRIKADTLGIRLVPSDELTGHDNS